MIARAVTIAGRRISDADPCYVIAEIGHNHGGSVVLGQQLIRAAARCGADAVKFQKRDNATLYTDTLLKQPYDHEHSYGRTYGAHRAALEWDVEAYQQARAEAAACHVACFATAFDERSADFLMGVGVPAIKIASGGITDEPLLRHVAALQVPIILSTGGCEERDIDRAISWLTAVHTHLALLHCTAAYPVFDYTELNLRYILTLRERYPHLVIGWSGHVSGIAMAMVAYAFGARIIEHHVTLDRASKGTDHAFSLEPKGLATLVDDLAKLKLALGDGVKVFYDSERKPIAKMRRTRTEKGWQITG